jgi:multidrug efflux pump subunit AcrB
MNYKFNPAVFSVKNWQFTLLVFALLTVLGLSTLTKVPRTEDPQFPIPVLQINAVLPGADAIDVEQLLVKPIEDVIDGLDGVKETRATAADGVGVVIVEFGWDEDPEEKYNEVVREVNGVRGNLPSAISRLEVLKFRTSEASIRQVALVSDVLPWRRMQLLAKNLRERINRVPGVRTARVWGAPESEMRVAVDLGRLKEYNIPVTAISDAIRNAGLDLPVGAVHVGERRFNVKTQGAFKSADQVRDVPVTSINGRVVKVRDVASVQWNIAEADHITRYNGKRAVFITANQKDGEDVIRLRGLIDSEVRDFEKTLPGSVKLENGFDQAKNVQSRLARLYKDFGIALVLVLITLLPLGFRAGLVVLISIPLSLLMAIIGLYQFGFTVNQLTISGLVLALGLLVDDSIVVTENIARFLRDGYGRTEAAIAATGQISVAVVGCTAALMFSFLPLMFLPEGSGQFIKSLPVAVLFAVGASLIVSLTVIPFLASRLLSKHEKPEGNRLLQVVNAGIQKLYRPALHWALTHPRRTVMVIMGTCMLAFPIVSIIGTSLFPPAGTPQYLLRIEAATGSSLVRTQSVLEQVEKDMAGRRQIKWYMSNLGKGNPQIYYNQRQRQSQANFAEIFFEIDRMGSDASVKLIDDMRAKYAKISGAEIKMIIFENGPPIEAPIAVRIQGDNLAVLKRLAAQAEQIMTTTQGSRDVDNPMRIDRTDLNLGIDEAKAASLGVPTGIPKRIARLALSGEVPARYRDADGEDFPVRVRLPMDGRNDISAFDAVYVPTVSGATTPLKSFASPYLESSPSSINRRDRRRLVTLTSYVQTGYLTSKVNADIFRRLGAELKLPPGYAINAGGQADAQSRSFAGMTTAVLIAIFGIVGVLLLEFGKLKTAAVVAGIIPLGLFGAVLALLITGNALSFTAMIGLIALIGIEIKNSILLVDFTEQLRAQGVELREAIERAGEVRFLPVLLTSATAIGSLLPLAFEDSGLFSPMAIAIIGGLITSTFMSRISTPALYLLIVRK